MEHDYWRVPFCPTAQISQGRVMTPQEKYKQQHPDRVAATLQAVKVKTIKRPSVRFLTGQDDELYQWLESRYGSVGGPQIRQALNELKTLTAK